MDTSELEVAYRDVLEVAGRSDGPGLRPGRDDEEWGPGDVLAHLVVNDRLLSRSVRSVLDGAAESYDNAAATDLAGLRAEAERLGGGDGLVGGLEASSRELLELVTRLDEGQAATPLAARIVDGGEVVLDRTVPIASLLATQARVHLPTHARQLGQLLGMPP